MVGDRFSKEQVTKALEQANLDLDDAISLLDSLQLTDNKPLFTKDIIAQDHEIEKAKP